MTGAPAAGGRETVHRARWVLAGAGRVLDGGFVRLVGGRIREVGRGRPRSGAVVDHGEGVLMPSLVNAHTHLELTALAGRVSPQGGFAAWVTSLIAEREAAGPARLAAAVPEGIAALRAGGAAVAGEVSTLGLSRGPFMDSGLGGVWFREHLGGAVPGTGCRPGVPAGESVAAHAPHTTAPVVLRALKAAARRCGMPFSIHLDESRVEREFLRSGSGAWADLLTARAIDFSRWGLPADGPVAHLDDLGLLDASTLAVHLTFSGPRGIRRLAERGVRPCLCPRSNHLLHGRLPDLQAMMDAGLNPCLGTDSLASADSLSMFDEMAFAARAFPGLAPETVLRMATEYGAAALGVGNVYGRLAPGRAAVMLHVPLAETRAGKVAAAVVRLSDEDPRRVGELKWVAGGFSGLPGTGAAAGTPAAGPAAVLRKGA